MTAFDREFGPQRQAALFERLGAGDELPVPLSYEALERLAAEELPESAHAFLAGGAGSETTMGTNRRAFERWGILPRMLRDVTDRDLSVDLLDHTLPVPFVLAPIGMQTLYDPAGERATAAASAAVGVPTCLSTVSSATFETVAAELGDVPKWAQLYLPADEAVSRSFLRRVEEAGYDALVVTVDTPYTGWRTRHQATGDIPLFDGHGVANFFEDPAFRERLADPPEADRDAAIAEMIEVSKRPEMTWDAVDAVAAETDLPVLVKGILHPEDAIRAMESAAGVVVSNHGGRQVDGSVAPLETLPAIVDAVGEKGTIVLDSGVRNGADAFKALALGADAVGLGRPYVYALAAGGEAGVRALLKNVVAEFDLTLALAGHDAVTDLSRDALLDRGEAADGNPFP
jgi:isopentenyl-diphosphate delta-isomerase